MLTSTLTAMTINLMSFAASEPTKWLLLAVGGVLWLLGIWIVVETISVLRSKRRESSWEVPFDGVATSPPPESG